MIDVSKADQLYSTLTQEEHQAVIDKMRLMTHLPAGHMAREDELYLEQQLTEMLGFEVAAEYENTRLGHSIGVMEALHHLKRHPSDTLQHHDTYREAGVSQYRSAFGWFTELGQLTPKAIQREKYYFAVQADALPEWQSLQGTQKNWWRYRKMVMINPYASKAVVGVVGDVGPLNRLQHQFGGSPEVIREGEVWNLQSQGHVLLFFINDPDDRVPLGPMSLAFSAASSV